jgi:hypothetical protein
LFDWIKAGWTMSIPVTDWIGIRHAEKWSVFCVDILETGRVRQDSVLKAVVFCGVPSKLEVDVFEHISYYIHLCPP